MQFPLNTKVLERSSTDIFCIKTASDPRSVISSSLISVKVKSDKKSRKMKLAICALLALSFFASVTSEQGVPGVDKATDAIGKGNDVAKEAIDKAKEVATGAVDKAKDFLGSFGRKKRGADDSSEESDSPADKAKEAAEKAKDMFGRKKRGIPMDMMDGPYGDRFRRGAPMGMMDNPFGDRFRRGAPMDMMDDAEFAARMKRAAEKHSQGGN
jgi:hypothetical protein